MAILNGIEGRAHVGVAADRLNWNGYILLEADPGNLRYFDIAGPQAQTIYEGPVYLEGKYLFVSGNVRITKVHFTPEELKVEFKGIEIPNINRIVEDKPKDYLD